MLVRLSIVATISLALASVAAVPEASTIEFSGFTWHVKEGFGGPGPNTWSRDNVYVDGEGALHLRVSTQAHVGWAAAEVWTTERLAFGSYVFRVRGTLGALPPDVVLGLFTYGPPDAGPDATNEIDVELSRWGDPTAPLGQNVVWPAVQGIAPTVHHFEIPPAALEATFQFDWEATGVAFTSSEERPFGGWAPLDSWAFAPEDPAARVPSASAPLHLNLWIRGGGKLVAPVEVVIESVDYEPNDH